MQTLINLLEATRFLSDHAPEARDEEGNPLLSIGAKAVTILLQIEKESDQRILLACLLHPFESEFLSEKQIQGIFGKNVLEYHRRSHQPESLVGEKLQRLMTKDQRIPLEAGRKILMANAIARIEYSDIPETRQKWLGQIEPFGHLYANLQALLPQ